MQRDSAGPCGGGCYDNYKCVPDQRIERFYQERSQSAAVSPPKFSERKFRWVSPPKFFLEKFRWVSPPKFFLEKFRRVNPLLRVDRQLEFAQLLFQEGIGGERAVPRGDLFRGGAARFYEFHVLEPAHGKVW